MPDNFRVELRSIIPRISPGANKEARRIVGETAQAIEDRARDRIPQRTGETARSVRHVFIEDLVAEIGTDSPIGAYLEFGTRPHTIRPVRAQALRFVIDGEVIFATVVRHPGTQPQPWLLPAFEQEKNEFIRRIREDLGGWLEEQNV